MLKKILAIPLLLFAFVSIMAVDLGAYDVSTLPEGYDLIFEQDGFSENVEYNIGYSYNQALEKDFTVFINDTGNEMIIMEEGNENLTDDAFGTNEYIVADGVLTILYETDNLEIIWDTDGTISWGDGSDSSNIVFFDQPNIKVYGEGPSIIEIIFGTISTVVLGGISVVAFLFSNDGIINVFWTAGTETTDGALTFFGIISLLGVGFAFAFYGLRYVAKLMRMRK